MRTASPEGLLHAHADERLAVLAAEGDQRAFALLVERHHGALLAFARKTAGHERAEDVLQQSLLQAWSALRGGTEVQHVRGWLFQIVRRGAWQATEQGSDHAELPQTLMGSDGPHAGLEERLRLREVLEHVGQLPQQQRLALVQTALEGRSRAEVAATLGVTEGAVRQLLHRGRERLRQAAAAIVPFPLIRWLTRAAEREDRSGVAAEGGVAATGATAVVAKVAVGLLASGAVAAGADQEIRHLRAAPSASTAAAAVDVAWPSSAVRNVFTGGPGLTGIAGARGAAPLGSALGGVPSALLPTLGAAAAPAAGQGQQPAAAIDGPAGAAPGASRDAGAADVPRNTGSSTGDAPGTRPSIGPSSPHGGTSSGTSGGSPQQGGEVSDTAPADSWQQHDSGHAPHAVDTVDDSTSSAGSASPDAPSDPAPTSGDPAADPSLTESAPWGPAATAEPVSPDDREASTGPLDAAAG